MHRCQFVEWLDDPWPKRVQKCLKDMWEDLKRSRCMQDRVAEALQHSIEMNDIATFHRVALQNEVNKTKRLADRLCRGYRRQAIIAKFEKTKLLFLVQCLLGVIIFLVVAMVFKN